MAELVKELANTITTAGVKASYGEPTTVDGEEMVPVSLVWYGFGAGGGGKDDSEGEGGGGGGYSLPVGVYTGGPEGLRFQPNVISLLAVSIPVIWVAGRALARIIKALKK